MPFASATGVNSGSAGGPKGLSSLVTSTGVSFQSSAAAAAAASSQASGKMGKGLSGGVRQPFPVSLPLAYAHPQLALLAAQTMHQIRHPRLPMAQFGGTFSPAASTWGPFPVRPVSPGSANSSPKHNGGSSGAAGQARSGSAAHGEPGSVGLPAGSGAPNAHSSPAPGSPHTPNPTPYNPQPSGPTPSSVRKQLFAPDAKPAGVNPISAAGMSGGNAARSLGSPVHHAAATPGTSQPPLGVVAQPLLQAPKTESGAMGPQGKEKPSLPLEHPPISASDSISSAAFTAPSMVLPPKPEPRQHLAPPPSSVASSEAPPPLLPPQQQQGSLHPTL